MGMISRAVCDWMKLLGSAHVSHACLPKAHDDPAADLHDYASKEWSGLLRDFYLVRWELFVRDFESGFDEPRVERIDYFDFEKKWTEKRSVYPTEPTGDPVDAAVKALAMTSSRGAESSR